MPESSLEERLAGAAASLGKARLRDKLSDGDFAALLDDDAEWLRSQVPESLWKALVNGDGKPRKLEGLSLRSLILLSLVHRQLKTRFSEAEKGHLAILNDSLMRLYAAHEGLPQKLIFPTKPPLDKALTDALVGLGVSASAVEEAVEAGDASAAEELWAELAQDDLFHKAFLKHARKALKMEDGISDPAVRERLEKALSEVAEAKEGSAQDTFAGLAQELLDTLKPLLRCEMSKDGVLESPKTLPCLHSFSAAALKKALKSSDKTVTCGICGTRVAAADDNAIDVLPASFVLSAFLGLQRRLSSAAVAEEAECALCVLPAASLSLHSGLLYCHQHNTALYRREDEAMVSASELAEEGRAEALLASFCAQHRQPLAQFCQACQVPLCGAAACVSWHSQHGELKLLSEVGQASAAQLRRLGALLKDKAARLRSRADAAAANQIAVADLQENVRGSLNSYFKLVRECPSPEDLAEQLESRREEALRDLDKAAQLSFLHDDAASKALANFADQADEALGKLESLDLEKDPVRTASPEALAAMSRQKNSLLGLLADTAEGNSLAESKTISYPEGHLRSLLQSITNLKSSIAPAGNGRGWELLLKVPSLRYFCVRRSSQLYVIRKSMLAGSSVYAYDLADLNAPPVLFADSGTHDFQALAFAENGDLLVPDEVQSSLELPSLRMRKTVSVTPFGLNRERKPPLVLDALNTYAKVLLKTSGPRVLIGDDQCVVELEGAKVVRKFDFYTMVRIGDFCPAPERESLLVTDTEKHRLLVFDCRRQEMVSGTMVRIGDFCPAPERESLLVTDTEKHRLLVFDCRRQEMVSGTMVRIGDFCPAPERESLLVTDTEKHRLLVFDCRRQEMVSGTMVRIGDFCPAPERESLLVTDTEKHRLLVFDCRRQEMVSGTMVRIGDFCPAPERESLLVTDTEKHRLLVFDCRRQEMVSGTMVRIGDFCPAPERESLLVTDTEKHRLLVFDCRRQEMVSGTMVRIGDFCPAPERESLLVTDTEKHRLLVFDCRRQEMVSGTMVRIGDFCPAPERESLLVTDTEKHRLLVFDCRRQEMVSGTMVRIGDFCPAPERESLLVTDTEKHRLLVFDCRRQEMVSVGSEGPTPGNFSHPSGVAVDSLGHVFVADAGNSRVQVFDLHGRFLKQLPYPQSLKDVTDAPGTPTGAPAHLQVCGEHLYLWDSRLANIYRLKYL